jgi:hypothetical protein
MKLLDTTSQVPVKSTQASSPTPGNHTIAKCDDSALSALQPQGIVAFADARCFVQFDTSGQGSSVDAEPVAIVGGDGPYLPLLSINPDSPFAVRSELFHSNGVSGGYKVGFAVGSLLHSVAKVLRNAYPE